MSIALRLVAPVSNDNTIAFTFSINTKMVTYSEEQLVAGLKKGRQDMFSYLYDSYAAALMGVIFRRVQSRECAEDLLQEVFEKIWKHIDSYDSRKARLFTWMITLASNHITDFTRKKSSVNRKATSGESAIEKSISIHSQDDWFDCICIKKNILSLKPEYRCLVGMAYFYGFTQSEISRKLNMPLGTVKTKLRTAILELRKKAGEG